MTYLTNNHGTPSSRRAFLRRGLFGLGVTAALPAFLQQTTATLAADALDQGREKYPNRILVVVEMTGGNDGLNTVVPYNNDVYYRQRPTLAIAKNQVRRINDEVGWHPQLMGLERLYKEGQLAIVQGCGYPNPDLSHFVAMEYWHTAVPHGTDARGWVGRFADAAWPTPRRDCLVSLGRDQSPAVRSRVHAPLVFDDPRRFTRQASTQQQETFAALNQVRPSANNSLNLLRRISANAADSSVVVREAFTNYRTPVNYGLRGQNLAAELYKVAALIHAKLPTRVYYVRCTGFDTHANQASSHNLLMVYLSDALRGFMEDVTRMGRADDVAIMMFTEFGRRVNENASGGTDHGTATPMFVLGKHVKGGLHGRHPSLTDLDAGNLRMTTDFRRVYATLIKEWMGYEDTRILLKGDFPTLGLFAT